jgi:hypothetical protein
MEVLSPTRTAAKDVATDKPPMFVVWIETNMGTCSVEDWEMNSPPQPIHTALTEAEETRAYQYPTLVAIEGFTPRLDGLFSNPETNA